MEAFHYDTIDSTNEEAKRLVRAGRITGPAFVLAEGQTAGKGQFGRTWCSPPNAGIYLSVLDVSRRPIDLPFPLLTLSGGVACAEAIRRRTGIDVRLKPINDLYVDGRKLGGILTETVSVGNRVEAFITGVGINVHGVPRDIPEGTTRPVCIQDLLDRARFLDLDINALAADLVFSIHSWNNRVLGGDIEGLRQAWERNRVADAPLPIPLQTALDGHIAQN